MHEHVNHLSLCAGIGGIDLGLRSVCKGLRTVAMVKREAFCTAVLVKAMEQGELDPCPIYPDLVRFPWNHFRGRVDLITGGFPCQPFAICGSRKATEDERHLWPYIKDGIESIRPAAVFFENVDGIATAKSPGYHSVLHNVLSDLEGMGYRATAGCFTAAEVGATHQRRRWFILGLNAAVANTDPDTRDEGQSRRASGEVQEEGTRLRGGESQGQAGEEPWSGDQLAYRNGSGLEVAVPGDPQEGRQDAGRPAAGCGEHRFPAGPGQRPYQWEHPRAIKSCVGGKPHGIPFRVDRLRALGNAVVPQVAALAFSKLYWRLQGE